MRILFSLMVYSAASISLLSLFYFVAWAFSMPSLLINGFESSGLPPLPESYPWRAIIMLKLVGGFVGWVSLIYVFSKRDKHISDISRFWYVGLVAGFLTAITMVSGFHVLSFPPIILAGLLIMRMVKNEPNKAV